MTVDGLSEWLVNAMNQAMENGQDISKYKVTIPYNSACEAPINDEGIDHVKEIVWFRSDP